MSEGVWGRPESPHSQPIIYESIKNNVVYYNIPLSTGTIKNMVTRCAEKIKPVLTNIRKALIAAPLLHCDETGTRVEGKTR